MYLKPTTHLQEQNQQENVYLKKGHYVINLFF